MILPPEYSPLEYLNNDELLNNQFTEYCSFLLEVSFITFSSFWLTLPFYHSHFNSAQVLTQQSILLLFFVHPMPFTSYMFLIQLVEFSKFSWVLPMAETLQLWWTSTTGDFFTHVLGLNMPQSLSNTQVIPQVIPQVIHK